MTFYDVVDEFAAVSGRTKRESTEICTQMLEVIMEAMRAEEPIKIYGFGSLVPFTRKSKPVKSVVSRSWVNSKPRKGIKFTIGDVFESEINALPFKYPNGSD